LTWRPWLETCVASVKKQGASLPLLPTRVHQQLVVNSCSKQGPVPGLKSNYLIAAANTLLLHSLDHQSSRQQLDKRRPEEITHLLATRERIGRSACISLAVAIPACVSGNFLAKERVEKEERLPAPPSLTEGRTQRLKSFRCSVAHLSQTALPLLLHEENRKLGRKPGQSSLGTLISSPTPCSAAPLVPPDAHARTCRCTKHVSSPSC